jgi:zinc-finger of a C2HC-type
VHAKDIEPTEDEELNVCPEGCGRSFKKDALDKHVKVCKAVF